MKTMKTMKAMKAMKAMTTMTTMFIIAFALLAGAARADEAADKQRVEEARTYFEAGKQAYEAGDYPTAIRSFDQALRALPRPPIRFSLAQAYRKQYYVDRDAAKLKAAVRLYREYTQEVPRGGRRDDAAQYLGELSPQLERLEAVHPIPSAPAVPEAKTQLMVMSQVKQVTVTIDGGAAAAAPLTRDVAPGPHRIHAEAPGHFPLDLDGLAVDGRLVVVEATPRPQPARIALATPAGAEVALDGRDVGTAPLPGGVIVTAAGKHYLTVSEHGHEPFVREVELDHGQTLKLDAPLARTAQRKASLWVLGGSGALLVGGGVTTVLAWMAQSDAQGILDRGQTQNLTMADLQAYNDARARRDRLVTVSAVLYGTAAAVGITGLLLYLTDHPRAGPPPASGGTIVPVATPEELGMAYLRRF
jgi:PEGA domain-containing protein